MTEEVLKGTTSYLLELFIQNSSVSTGAGLTGLVHNSASLTAYYYRKGAASAVAITLADMTVGTWVSGGFKAVDGTNMPGVYQLGVPNAAIATGAREALIMLNGATNMAPALTRIPLVDYNSQDSVRLGLTALPNAAAAANGGVPTVDANNAVKVQSGTGANQISISSGVVQAGMSATERNALADAILGRDFSLVSSVGNNSLVRAGQFTFNWAVIGTTLNVYDHNGSVVWTAPVTSSAGANPVVSVRRN